MNILITLRSLAFASFISFLTSCLPEDDTESQIEIDDQRISEYLNTNQINAVRTSSGLYYVELQTGSGSEPNADNVAEVSYVLRLLDGTQVATDDSYIFKPEVGAFMFALAQGVLLMREGGTTEFYVPSHLAFGSGSGEINGVNIPANSIMILQATLTDVRTDGEQELYENDLLLNYLDSTGMVYDTLTPSGLIKVTLQAGTDPATPQLGRVVNVDYEGTLLNGEQFDASENFSFTLDSASFIPGWVEGISLMTKGERSLLLLPSHRAYGAVGTQSSIGPYDPIIFEITLNDFL